MSRRTRPIERLQQDQATVGMQRAERLEQEELAGRKKHELSEQRTRRSALVKEKDPDAGFVPRRTARPGKPLKR